MVYITFKNFQNIESHNIFSMKCNKRINSFINTSKIIIILINCDQKMPENYLNILIWSHRNQAGQFYHNLPSLPLLHTMKIHLLLKSHLVWAVSVKESSGCWHVIRTCLNLSIAWSSSDLHKLALYIISSRWWRPRKYTHSLLV